MIELQTTAIGALVTKDTLEKLSEKYDKLFDALIAHDRFTNEQLADVRGQITEVDGKVVGLQTQLRQTEKRIDILVDQIDTRFTQVDAKVDRMETRFDQIDTRFDRMETLLAHIIERLP